MTKNKNDKLKNLSLSFFCVNINPYKKHSANA